MDIPNGGYANCCSGYDYGSMNWGSSGQPNGSYTGGNPGFTYWGITNSGTPAVGTQWRFPPNWDNTKAVDLLLSVWDAPESGGSFKLNGAIYCQAANAAVTISTNTASTTGTLTFSHSAYAYEAIIPSLAYTGCSPTSLAFLQITRDNTVSGNIPGNLGILQMSVQLYRF